MQVVTLFAVEIVRGMCEENLSWQRGGKKTSGRGHKEPHLRE